MKDWEIDSGVYGKRLTLHVDWSDSLIRVFEREQIQEIVLFKPNNSGFSSLDFLGKVSWLKSFTLLDLLTENISGIHFLSDLRSIYMGDYSKKAIDFASFPELKECRMEFSHNRLSVVSCPKLELLSMLHFSLSDLSKLVPLRHLTTLDISQGKLADIRAITEFRHLEHLNLVLLKSLQDIAPLGRAGELQTLSLEGTRGFRTLDALSGLGKLRRLNISNCGQIDSIAPLVACRSLEILEFSEDTNILDGDLQPILQMPNLKYISLMNRKHYNLRREDIPIYHLRFPQEWLPKPR